MSPLNVTEEREMLSPASREVATNGEILFLFAIFLFVLFLLYPKEMLQKQVLSEKSNYELTGVYLENMLRLDPGNTHLMLAAAAVSLERGNLDLSEKLLEVLRKSKDPEIRNNLEKIEYRLVEMQISYSHDPAYIVKKRKKLASIVANVAKEGRFEKKDALVWYRRALDVSQKKAALHFIESLSDTSDPDNLEQCVYLMVQPENRHRRIACAEKLSLVDGKSAKKWLVAAWTLYAEEGNYKKAEEILERLVKIDPSYRDILAETRRAAGRFSESADLFMLLYRNSGSEARKKEYLLKAIQALASGKLNSKAIALAHTYEAHYIDDEEMMQKLIKLYLSMGELEAARALSLKLMERER